MCGSSKNKQTSKSTTKADPRAEAVYTDLLSRLSGVMDQGYDPYEGERVAGFTPQQQALLAQMSQPGGAGAPAYQAAFEAAQRGAGPVTTEDINKFMNPYMDSVVNTTLQGMERGFGRDITGLKGNAIMAGAFGGDRAGVAEADLRAQQGEKRAQMEAQLRSQGFDQATANAIAEKNLQLSGSAALTQAGSGIGSGYGQAFGAASAEQALNQARLDVPYQNYLEARAHPYQQLQFGAGIGTAVGQGLGGTQKSTTTMPGPSPWSQVLGAGLAVAGLPTDSVGGSWLGKAGGGRVNESTYIDAILTMLGMGSPDKLVTDSYDSKLKKADGGRVDEVRSYEPTLRDKIAAYFMGDGKPSPELERLVGGIFGSTGLGETGRFGLADLTPAGIAFSADEALREPTTTGQVLNLGSAIFSAMPAAKAYGHGKRFIEDALDRRIAKDLDATYPPDINLSTDELGHAMRFYDRSEFDVPMPSTVERMMAKPANDMNIGAIADDPDRLSRILAARPVNTRAEQMAKELSAKHGIDIRPDDPDFYSYVRDFKIVPPTEKAEGGSVLSDAMKAAEEIKQSREPDWKYHYPPRPDVASNYEQSYKEQIASILLDKLGGGEAARRLVENFLGTSGLGPTGIGGSGIGVIDMIPGAAITSNVDDAYSNIKRGNYSDAIIDTLTMLLPSAIKKAASKVDPKGFTAYDSPAGPHLDDFYTPDKRRVVEEAFVDAMSDPKLSLNPKKMEGIAVERLLGEGKGIPLDLGRRIDSTMRSFPPSGTVGDVDIENRAAIRKHLNDLRARAKGKGYDFSHRYLSVAPGIPFAADQLMTEDDEVPTRAEGGTVPSNRNWLGFSPEASHGIMAAGLAMMAGQSPYAAANIGAGGLAGLQSYEDYIREQQRRKMDEEKLALDQTAQKTREDLAREELDIRRKDVNNRMMDSAETRSFRERELALRERPEFDMVKDMATEDGRPVVLNKRTGVYHDATTGEPIPPGITVGPIKKKYTDLPVGVQKEVMEARDVIQSSVNAVTNLKQALAINNKAYAGPLAAERGWLKSMVEGDEGGPGTATENLDNIIKGGALENLKAIFGAAPTEGERQILLDIQGSTSKAPKVREEIYTRAIAAALAREEYNKKKVQAMISGTYFTEDFPGEPVSWEAYLPAAKGMVGIGDETPTGGGVAPFPEVGEERTFKGPDGKPVVGVWDGKEWRPK